jgi:tellurium resistance protein TerZ
MEHLGIDDNNEEVFDLVNDDGLPLTDICIGVNWDRIEKRGTFKTRHIKIDMDISCVIFDRDNNLVDVVYYYQMKSKDKAIIHTGDDSRSNNKDIELDNEVILLHLDAIDIKAQRLIFVLNAYDKVEFAQVPHMKVRIYEGKPNHPESIYVNSDIYNKEELFYGYTSMLIAELIRHDDRWTFSAIFELTDDKDLEDSIKKLKIRLNEE